MLKRYFYYYRRLGWQGIMIFSSLNNKKKSILRIKLKNISASFYLRQNTSDVNVFEHIFAENQYNVKFDFKPKYILDLGANIGLASIYFNNRFPDATIFAVEPDGANFEMLLKNTESYEKIHCFQYGIWDKSANLEIYDTGNGHWAFMTREADHVNDNTIEAKSIDELMQEFNIPGIDILKIDIEGSEKQIFENGSDKWIPKVRSLIIELHDRHKEGCAKAFFKALSSYDFSLRLRQENLICDFKQQLQ